MLQKIIKTYLVLFVVFFVGYSLVNWLLTTKLGLIKVDKEYSNFWAPFILVYIPTYFILRPLIKKSSFRPKSIDSLLWGLLPFSISVPTAFSQQYFKDISYQVVSVDSPSDIVLHPKERFFRFKTYHVIRSEFSLFKERHVTGSRGNSLNVNNYYIAPLYSDSLNPIFNVAYGFKFDTSISYALFTKDEAPYRIEQFNINSAEAFSNFDLYSANFFERQMDSEDEENFIAAWRRNDKLMEINKPIILVPKHESFDSLISRGRNMTIYSILICLTITIGLLFVFNYYATKSGD